MIRWMLAAVIALLVAGPVGARAEDRPLNALEVGAWVATCMHQARNYPPGGGVELVGNIDEVTLSERARPFVVLHRRDFDPTEEPWMVNQIHQPPMAFDVVGKTNNPEIEEYRRETLRYAGHCFDQVMYPQAS